MGNILLSTPLSDLEFVAFDTETTGLSPVAAKLVELSGVKFRTDGEIISNFSQLINPETDIPEQSTVIHGITNDMVKNQPTYTTVVPEFFQWAAESVLVAHNASFDMGFLEIALAKLHRPSPSHAVIDTLPLARNLLARAPNHQLKTLIEHLGLEPGEYHRALADSYHVKALLIKLIAMIPSCNTWEDLSQVSGFLEFCDLSEQGLQQLTKNSKGMPSGFESIGEAIASGLSISLTYDNGNSGTRIVTPHSVHSWRGNAYLSADRHLVKAERTFRLDKIVSFQILTQA